MEAEGTAAGQEAAEYVRETRHRRLLKDAQLKESIARTDPEHWICPYCQNEKKDGEDCYNEGSRTKCWHCSKFRPSINQPKYKFHQRWLCPNCSYFEKTLSGLVDRCPECGRERDWTEQTRWAYDYLPGQAPKPELILDSDRVVLNTRC